MIRYKDENGNLTKEYRIIAWLAKTWLPIITVVLGAVPLVAGLDMVYVGAVISGTAIPVLNRLMRDAKIAQLKPETFYEADEE